MIWCQRDRHTISAVETCTGSFLLALCLFKCLQRANFLWWQYNAVISFVNASCALSLPFCAMKRNLMSISPRLKSYRLLHHCPPPCTEKWTDCSTSVCLSCKQKNLCNINDNILPYIQYRVTCYIALYYSRAHFTQHCLWPTPMRLWLCFFIGTNCGSLFHVLGKRANAYSVEIC